MAMLEVTSLGISFGGLRAVDELSMKIEEGGLVGLNFCVHFLREDSNAHFEDLLRHADHFWSLGGETTLCLGSDYDGTDVPPELDGIEKMQDLYEFFLKHNYKESLVNSLFFDNASKFFATL